MENFDFTNFHLIDLKFVQISIKIFDMLAQTAVKANRGRF